MYNTPIEKQMKKSMHYLRQLKNITEAKEAKAKNIHFRNKLLERFCFLITRVRRQHCEQSPRSLTHGTNSHATDHGAKKGRPTRTHGAQQGTTLPDSATRHHTRFGRRPQHASTTEDFSSCTPGQHLRPGLVTLHRGPIPSTLRRPECYTGR